MSAINFAYTIVYVEDVGASLDFFERAFGLTRRFLHESGAYGELETGATTLSFARHDIARGNLGQDYRKAADGAPLGMEIGLSTPDVPAAYARALGQTGQIDKAWYVADRLREFHHPLGDDFFNECQDYGPGDPDTPFQCLPRPPARRTFSFEDFRP